jgi:hypothetical protein
MKKITTLLVILILTSQLLSSQTTLKIIETSGDSLACMTFQQLKKVNTLFIELDQNKALNKAHSKFIQELQELNSSIQVNNDSCIILVSDIKEELDKSLEDNQELVSEINKLNKDKDKVKKWLKWSLTINGVLVLILILV